MPSGLAASSEFEDLCRSPWLVVYGPGLEAEELAGVVAEQCQAERIRCRVCAIDDRDGVDLFRYQGLVAVLPSFNPELRIRTALEPFAELITDYRARWTDGLATVRAGVIPAYEAGPISLLGQRVLAHNPTLRSGLRRSCVVHLLDAGDSIDLFAPFRVTTPYVAPDVPWADKDGTGGRDGDRPAFAGVASAWIHLQTWGIQDGERVQHVLRAINACRSHFEKQRLSQLYRPLPGINRNRLDLILDGPDTMCGDSKTWNENGARVWRHVYNQLRAVEPGLKRPGNPNAGGAQNDLRQLYVNLLIVDRWLQLSGEDVPHLSG